MRRLLAALLALGWLSACVSPTALPRDLTGQPCVVSVAFRPYADVTAKIFGLYQSCPDRAALDALYGVGRYTVGPRP